MTLDSLTKRAISDSFDRAKKLAMIPDANLVRYTEPFSLARMLGILERATADFEVGSWRGFTQTPGGPVVFPLRDSSALSCFCQ